MRELVLWDSAVNPSRYTLSDSQDLGNFRPEAVGHIYLWTIFSRHNRDTPEMYCSKLLLKLKVVSRYAVIDSRIVLIVL